VAAAGSRRTLTLGLIAAAACAIVAIGVTSYFIGAPGDSKPSQPPAASVPTPNPTDLAIVPTPPGTQPSSVSAAADALGNKAWADMSQDERDLVRTSVTSAWENTALRVLSSAVLARDMWVVDGKVRAGREYQAITASDGSRGLRQAITFYCDNLGGSVENFSYSVEVDGSATIHQATLAKDSYPYFGFVSQLDWSDVKDLGWDTVDGRRAHGLDIVYANAATGKSVRTQNWFDVGTGLLIRRYEPTSGADFHLDWRQPAPVVIPANTPKAPCSDVFYRTVPAAMPPGYQFSQPTAAAGATPQPSATAAAAATP